MCSMTKINKRIEIVSSAHLGLSSMSWPSRQAIEVVLAKHYVDVRITIINSLTDLEALVIRQPDLVFLGMECLLADQTLGLLGSNKIWLAEYLDEQGIAYTGSSQRAIEISRDKSLAKQVIREAGLNTAPFWVVGRNQLLVMDQLSIPFPLFVKPVSRGGGAGIDSDSVVYDFEHLKAKVLSIAVKHRSDSLIEEYLPGREFSVAILKSEISAGYSVMPIELIAQPDEHGRRLLGRQAKLDDFEQAIAITDQTIKSQISSLALGVFSALTARDFARIDIRIDKSGNPQFLEANPIPCLIGGYGSFHKACLINLNMDYESMILSIVRLAMDRQGQIIGDLSQPIYADNFLPALGII